MFDEVEDALLLWLKQARTYGAPIGGPLLKQKANELAAELGHEGFHYSDGWDLKKDEKFPFVWSVEKQIQLQ